MFQKLFKIILCGVCLPVFASPVFAGIYYVDDNGAASWAACEHNAGTPGPKSGTNACSLATANSNVAPGDIVFLRTGTYYPTGRHDCIHPGRSGTPANRITYQNYNGETVVLDGRDSTSEAILFSAGWDTGNPADGRSYITVRGINFTHWNKLGDMRYASYNEIADCIFSGHKGDGTGVGYNNFLLYQQSSHNWIHGNTWHTLGHYVGRDAGVLINIGHDFGGTIANSGNDYNTLENNHFYASGHHVLGVNNAKYCVIRNNYIHNEGWSSAGDCANWPTGVCGYRVMTMTDDSGLDISGSNLLENNSIAYGAQYGGPHLVTGASGSGLTIDTKKNIVRYNNLFGNVLFGIRFGSSSTQSITNDNHTYNNTFYFLGYNYDSWSVVNEDDTYLLDAYRCALYFYGTPCSGNFQNNVIKNNLAHDIWSETNRRTGLAYYPAFNVGNGVVCNIITNNWGNSGSGKITPFTPYPDPKFVDPDVRDPMALTLVNGKWTGKPDLSLQADSPAIDQAVHLTQANGSGSNSTTLVIDDAKYFQDGTWGSDLARATMQVDWIAIGTVDNVVKISSINYDTNTIILATAMTWNENAPVWLYKDSRGKVVLHGTAPDIGAYEYMPGIAFSSPTGGETWLRGFSHAINWSASGVTEPVKIELYKAGALNQVIADNQAVANGSYAWLIPANQAAGNDYTVKLTAGVHESTSGNFTIAAAGAPMAQTLAAQPITTNSAVLRGTVHSMGSGTSYHFEYGLTTAYDLTTPAATLNAEADATEVQAGLAGLTANTTYHFRLVASNSKGTAEGADRTFTTTSSGNGGGNSGEGGGGGGGGCFMVTLHEGLPWILGLALCFMIFMFWKRTPQRHRVHRDYFFICALICAFFMIPVRADTHTAASCAYDDVEAAVASARAGDTILLPEGSATWNTYLAITKGLIIIGAGIDKTIIKGNFVSNFNEVALFYYAPANPSLNEPFRITNMTIDGDLKTNCVKLKNTSIFIINQVRIDHCKIINAYYNGINIFGDVYGCIDNNIIAVSVRSPLYVNGNGYVAWTHSRKFGDSDNLFIEDNTISNKGFYVVSQDGARHLWRYNNFISTGDNFPLIDIHGNAEQYYGVSIVEVYGNKFDLNKHSGSFLDHRGGQVLAFFNKIVNNTYSFTTKVREEWPDATNPIAINDRDNPTPGHNSFLQHVSDSYYWNNRYGTTLFGTEVTVRKSGTATGGGNNYMGGSGFDESWDDLGPRFGLYIIGGTGVGQNRRITVSSATRLTVDVDWDTVPDATSQYQVTDDSCNALHENSEFWNHKASFDGTSGMGCGPLANRPSTCTPGVSYWATDQDCTQVSDDNTGAHPKIPIQGTLYKCTSPNNWEVYYTPFIYPHPLRTSGPLADTGIAVTSPGGGEIWVRGFSHAVTWSSSGVTEAVWIELFKSGVLNQVIAESQAIADGSHAWLIPAGQATGNDYTVKLTAGEYSDTSDAFTIADPSAPIVQTLAAQSITASSASLRGTVHPMGLATTYYFEYGLTTAYGSKTDEATLAAGDQVTAIQASIPGLTASTTYHFRLVATNGAGTTEGNDLTFTTSGGGGGGSGDSGGGGGGGGGCFISMVQDLSLWFMVLGLVLGGLVWIYGRGKSLERHSLPIATRPGLCHQNERVGNVDLPGGGFHPIKSIKEKQ